MYKKRIIIYYSDRERVKVEKNLLPKKVQTTWKFTTAQ